LKIKQKINSKKLSNFIAVSMENKKAEDIKIIKLKNIKNSVTDYFVVATGNSNVHIDSIAEGIEEDVFKNFHEKPWNKEGKDNAEWVLIDFIDVVAHVFNEKNRTEYNLEGLWGDNNEKSLN
tara:strand:+ start:3369 stop:3734 length:366 start_codon:yes stop_codon:yes gene_type:complete